MVDSLPADACSIVVEAARDHSAHCFLGLIVHGSEADLARLEAGTAGRGIRFERMGPDSGSIEAMLLFVAATRAEAALAMWRDAAGGKFGDLRVEVIVAPAARAADGIDLQNEARVQAADFIADPRS